MIPYLIIGSTSNDSAPDKGKGLPEPSRIRVMNDLKDWGRHSLQDLGERITRQLNLFVSTSIAQSNPSVS